MTAVAWPQLPVGEALEGLRVGWPPLVPVVGCLLLTPAICKPERDSSVHAVSTTELLGYLGPGSSLLTQRRRELALLLLEAAYRLCHAASFRRGSALDALGMPLNRTVTAYCLVRNLPVKPGEPVSEDHGFSGWLAARLCQKVEVDRRRLPGEIVNLPTNRPAASTQAPMNNWEQLPGCSDGNASALPVVASAARAGKRHVSGQALTSRWPASWGDWQSSGWPGRLMPLAAVAGLELLDSDSANPEFVGEPAEAPALLAGLADELRASGAEYRSLAVRALPDGADLVVDFADLGDHVALLAAHAEELYRVSLLTGYRFILYSSTSRNESAPAGVSPPPGPASGIEVRCVPSLAPVPAMPSRSPRRRLSGSAARPRRSAWPSPTRCP